MVSNFFKTFQIDIFCKSLVLTNKCHLMDQNITRNIRLSTYFKRIEMGF